jgi:hypothetical protein
MIDFLTWLKVPFGSIRFNNSSLAIAEILAILPADSHCLIDLMLSLLRSKMAMENPISLEGKSIDV